jgi:hypothetical protein
MTTFEYADGRHVAYEGDHSSATGASRTLTGADGARDTRPKI